MTPPMASPASQTITTVVFGIIATIISTVTVWQSYRAWRIWHDHHHHQDEVEQDLNSQIELGSRTNNGLQASPTGRSEVREAAGPALVDGGSGPINPNNQTLVGSSSVASPAAGRGPDGNHQQ